MKNGSLQLHNFQEKNLVKKRIVHRLKMHITQKKASVLVYEHFLPYSYVAYQF